SQKTRCMRLPQQEGLRYACLGDFSGKGRQGYGFDGLKVEFLGGAVDVDPHHVALGIEVHNQTLRNLARVRSRFRVEVDIKRVRLRIIMELHFRVLRLYGSLKLGSGKALWTVTPSGMVITRSARPPSSGTVPQKRIRPSGCVSRFSGLATIRSHDSRRM